MLRDPKMPDGVLLPFGMAKRHMRVADVDVAIRRLHHAGAGAGQVWEAQVTHRLPSGAVIAGERQGEVGVHILRRRIALCGVSLPAKSGTVTQSAQSIRNLSYC